MKKYRLTMVDRRFRLIRTILEFLAHIVANKLVDQLVNMIMLVNL